MIPIDDIFAAYEAKCTETHPKANAYTLEQARRVLNRLLSPEMDGLRIPVEMSPVPCHVGSPSLTSVRIRWARGEDTEVVMLIGPQHKGYMISSHSPETKYAVTRYDWAQQRIACNDFIGRVIFFSE